MKRKAFTLVVVLVVLAGALVAQSVQTKHSEQQVSQGNVYGGDTKYLAKDEVKKEVGKIIDSMR